MYLDDILVYSNNPKQHSAHVREVLTWLRRNWLYTQADKCEFHCNSCEYLGYMLSPDGLTMAQNKIQAIQDWPEPRKVWDIMSFLGFANFYCRLFTATRKSQYHSRSSPKKMSHGISLTTAENPSRN